MSGLNVDRNVPPPGDIDDKVSSWIRNQASGDAINSAEFRRYLNNLDQWGRWVPAITFAAPGDLAVTYSTQVGTYRRSGRWMHLTGTIITSAFTFTTASGNLEITGIPRAISSASSTYRSAGAIAVQGITKANYTQFVVSAQSSVPTFLRVICNGSGQASAFVTAADMPTGGTVFFQFEIGYRF